MKNLIPIEWSNQRVLTTRQVAEAYGVMTDRIRQNFRYAKKQFVEGVHYFKVEGDDLQALRRQVAGVCFSYANANPLPGGNSFVLYTVQGAARRLKKS